MKIRHLFSYLLILLGSMMVTAVVIPIIVIVACITVGYTLINLALRILENANRVSQ